MYPRSLQKKPSCLKGTNSMLEVGDTLQIKGDQKNRVEWHIVADHVDHLT